MEENAKYFVIVEGTGEKLTPKPIPLEEAKKMISRLEESESGRKLVLKQYLLG